MKSIATTLTLALVAASAIIATAQQAPSILGRTNIQILIQDSPGIPKSPAEAAQNVQRSADIYDPFYQRTKAAHDALQQAIAQRAQGMPDRATLEKQARAQSNANPIVSGMGGVDNIQQMTSEQRKAAALQSTAAFQQNLITGGGRNSPQMQAMMQRVMSDPEYRARFQKMSEAEKEAELRRNMGAVVASTPEQHQKAQQQLAAGRETADTIAVRNELTQMSQRMADVENEFARKDQAISQGKGSHEEIAGEIAAREAIVPVVELGEYGHDRDPQQMMALEFEHATRDRDRSALELGQRNALFAQRKAQYQQLVAAYQVWLKQNLGRINTSMSDPLNNRNTELAVIAYEDGLVMLADNLAKYSDQVTRDAARYENTFQERKSGQLGAAPTRLMKPKK
jgi:hypothetical protein